MSFDLHFTVNLLGLRDTNNLLFFSSAEERRAFLKCLWGLVNLRLWLRNRKKDKNLTVVNWVLAKNTHVVGSKCNLMWWVVFRRYFSFQVSSKSAKWLLICEGLKLDFPITLAIGLYYHTSNVQLTWQNVGVAVLGSIDRQLCIILWMSWTQVRQQLQQIHLLYLSCILTNCLSFIGVLWSYRVEIGIWQDRSVSWLSARQSQPRS